MLAKFSKNRRSSTDVGNAAVSVKAPTSNASGAILSQNTSTYQDQVKTDNMNSRSDLYKIRQQLHESNSSSPSSLYLEDDNTSKHHDSIIGEDQHRLGLISGTNLGVEDADTDGMDRIIDGISNTLNIKMLRRHQAAAVDSLSNQEKLQQYQTHDHPNARIGGSGTVAMTSNIYRKEFDVVGEDGEFTSESSSSSDDDSASSEEGNEEKALKQEHKNGFIGSEKGHESAEDYSDDEDEGEDGYKPGGYHAVKIGEVYNQRYVVIKKLGWGHFSTVWMVKDRAVKKNAQRSPGNSQFLALKVQKSAEHYTEAAMDEVELLDSVSKERKHCEAAFKLSPMGADKNGINLIDDVDHSHHVASLHDSFFHSGPNGRHMCMVFSMLGCNLLSVIKAFSYRGIPIPAVKKMIKGISKGLDFLHRKCDIIHTDLKPENVLLQFPSQLNTPNAIMGDELDAHSSIDDCGNVVSIEELETALRNPKTSTEDRKKIRKRLKKRRQKMRNRAATSNEDVNYDTLTHPQKTLSDDTIERILVDNETSRATRNAHERVLSRLSHSQFVVRNFASRISMNNQESTDILDDMVKISRPSKSELNAHFQLCGGQIGSRLRSGSSGVAELSFLLRAYVPEGEIADTVSAALGGIPWERNEENNAAREWRCGLSVQRPGQPSIATIFKLSQLGRKDLDDGLRKTWTHLSDLIGENLAGRDNVSHDVSRSFDSQARSLPFSLFTVKFSVLSTMVVLGFLESRLPGLIFFSYKRDEGSPPLDHVMFGPYSQRICKHPLAMKMKDAAMRSDSDNPSCANSVATSLFGFDLRMVKEFAARPTADEEGGASFQLKGSTMEKVSSWWCARQPIYERVKAFMGLHPKADIIDMPLFCATDGITVINNCEDFIEGQKEQSYGITNSSSFKEMVRGDKIHISETQLAVSLASHQPNLRDLEMLMKSRAVVVDLGNACWTHRHFSEDIQTRQYRAPEVLIGSKYDTSADMWSLGCITFELLTGDLLFDPREGGDYDRDEDHIAMFQELLGKIPKKVALNGKYSKNFFDRKGNLKHIKQLKFWPIEDVLHEKYHFSVRDAEEIANFMLPLLEYDSRERASAHECLQHEWLKGVS